MRSFMKFLSVVSCVSMIFLHCQPLMANTNQKANLPAGTPVPFQIDRVSQSGNVSAHVIQEIRNNDGTVIISNGTPVVIHAEFQEGKAPCKEGNLTISNATVSTVDGRQVLLTGGFSAKGEENVGLCVGLTVGLFFVITVFSLFMLLIPGEDVDMQQQVVHGFSTSQAL